MNKLRQLLKILKHLEWKIGTERELLDRQLLRLQRIGNGVFHQKFQAISIVKSRRDCTVLFTPIVGERQLRFSVRAVIPAAEGQVRGNIGRVIGRNLQQEHLAFLLFIQKLVAEQGRKSRGVIFGLLIGQKIGAHKLVNKRVEVEFVRAVRVSIFTVIGNPA